LTLRATGKKDLSPKSTAAWAGDDQASQGRGRPCGRAGGLGAINASDFQKQGDAYVNDVYGKSPVTLQIEVEGGVGEIDLELGGEPPAA